MTKQELIDLIKEKCDNAQKELDQNVKTTNELSIFKKCAILHGNIEAYIDIIALLESTELEG